MLMKETYIVITGTDEMLCKLAIQSRCFLKSCLCCRHTFFLRSGRLAFVIEVSRPQSKVCGKCKTVDPMSMATQGMDQSALLAIPDFDADRG